MLNPEAQSGHKSTVLDLYFELPIFNEYLKFTIVSYGETQNLRVENEHL